MPALMPVLPSSSPSRACHRREITDSLAPNYSLSFILFLQWSLRYFTEYQWLLDFSVYTGIVYVVSEVGVRCNEWMNVGS